MRRKYFGWAIAALATLGPMQASGGDRDIAEQIMTRLRNNRDAGQLKDFTLDMKVDKGVVLFRGAVSEADQKKLVMAAAKGIDGVNEVVDELKIQSQSPASKDEGFSFAKAVADQAKVVRGKQAKPLDVVPGKVMPTAAVEEKAAPAKSNVTAAVVQALGQAQRSGKLKGFGVDVSSQDGVIRLTGRAANAQQRDQIIQIAANVSGVVSVNEQIQLDAPLPSLPAPPALRAMPVAGPKQMPAQAVPYRMNPGQPTQAAPAAMQMAPAMSPAPMMGQPVPMGPVGGVASGPRYDAPNLPNYAWPGYAAHPNYAAVSYPQQYSPSAFPYIGPFYPYPQVPLGWRKVSLEWDDGWWYLDFTDR
ncbi:MAG: BON domain-containing protein [Planctomycetota bacterium]